MYKYWILKIIYNIEYWNWCKKKNYNKQLNNLITGPGIWYTLFWSTTLHWENKFSLNKFLPLILIPVGSLLLNHLSKLLLEFSAILIFWFSRFWPCAIISLLFIKAPKKLNEWKTDQLRQTNLGPKHFENRSIITNVTAILSFDIKQIDKTFLLNELSVTTNF